MPRTSTNTSIDPAAACGVSLFCYTEWMKRLFGHAFAFWQRYEHHLGLGAMIVGFIFDLLLAKRPDSAVDNILLLTYLVVAGAFIIMLNLRSTRSSQAHGDAEPLVLLLILQFCFGGLASNLLVLYGKSGTLTTSAIFLAVLAGLVLSNEYLRSRYSVLRVNVAIYYLLLLTYATIATPVFVTHNIGGWTFLLSGVLSLAWMAVFLAVLFYAVFRGRDTKSLRGVALIVGTIYVGFNALYFGNVIPPVPLSLKDVGIYHSVLKLSSGDYVALYEPAPWWEFWRDTSATYTTVAPGEASCFSSVFAPTDLNTPIYHRWEYDEPGVGWTTQARISYPIVGGNSTGYRGYSTKMNLQPGAWRCDVETAQGQLIGRVSFVVVDASSTPRLSQTTL